MCTVSFVPKGNTYIITSNRDEHISRPISTSPLEKIINGCKIIYPKDALAGGTWFAINENGGVIVLLNGAFTKHISEGNYRKSRGLILLDIITNKNPVEYLKGINLDNIEPFTIILFVESKLLELKWDANKKHIKTLDIAKNHIWSSITLYSEDIVEKRENLFKDFLRQNKIREASDIIDFHSNDFGDFENGFVIQRASGLKTFSITQSVITKDDISMKHHDLINDKVYNVSVATTSALNP